MFSTVQTVETWSELASGESAPDVINYLRWMLHYGAIGGNGWEGITQGRRVPLGNSLAIIQQHKPGFPGPFIIPATHICL